MGKLQVFYNKTIKLTNACIRDIDETDFDSIDNIIQHMQNYIRSKGCIPVGPIVQRMSTIADSENSQLIRIQLIMQVNNFINKVEAPYSMESVHRCRNCLFVHFHGEDYQLHFAYDKLNLISFEEDIPLSGTTYTVFTSKKDEEFSADIFMERKATDD